MGEIDIDKVAEIHRRIGLVLLRDWDPIGACEVPQAQDEYRGYDRGVYDVAVQTRSDKSVAKHLVEIERASTGLSRLRPWKARVLVAQKILDLVSDVGP